ncbi:hypothetical protein BRAS3843_1320026 [Bradyrhizobium sp. STM 3843]|nr:hypothetical protein BRAS3843_1320026 [Bradyrhizobium sp. STM 3843]
MLWDHKRIVSPNASPGLVFPREPSLGARLCIGSASRFGNETGRQFLVNGITVNKFTQTVASGSIRGSFSPILPSCRESRVQRIEPTYLSLRQFVRC